MAGLHLSMSWLRVNLNTIFQNKYTKGEYSFANAQNVCMCVIAYSVQVSLDRAADCQRQLHVWVE